MVTNTLTNSYKYLTDHSIFESAGMGNGVQEIYGAHSDNYGQIYLNWSLNILEVSEKNPQIY